MSLRLQFVAFGLALALAPGILFAQHDAVRTIVSCPAVDSLIGQANIRPKGRVRGGYDSLSGRSTYVSGARVFSKHQLHLAGASGWSGAGPNPVPGARLTILINDPSLYRELDSFAPPPVVVALEDSVKLTFDRPTVHSYKANDRHPMANMDVWVRSASWLALVRAEHAEIRILGRKWRVAREELADVQALFRVNYCPFASETSLPGPN